jgi:hypothetical protein
MRETYAVEEPTLVVSADVTSQVKQLLLPTPIHLIEIARRAGISVAVLAAALVELEMRGAATSLGGGYASSGDGGSCVMRVKAAAAARRVVAKADARSGKSALAAIAASSLVRA